MPDRFTRALAFGALAALLSSCQPPAPVADAPTEDPAELDLTVQSMLTVWNSNDVVMIDSIVTPDFKRVAPNGNATGPEELKAFIQGIHTVYPDFHITSERVAYDGDVAMMQWTVTGTNTGEGPTPPTGNAVKVSGVTVFTFRDGRIASETVFFDSADLQAQLAGKPAM